MNHFGFVKVAAGVPSVKVADPAYNAAQLEELIARAAQEGVRAVVFPELCLTGYTCGDLFLKPLLVNAAERVLAALLRRTEGQDIVFIVGMRWRRERFTKCGRRVLPRGDFGRYSQNLPAQL
jgi:NAD+ synthase (glutamine-hydrolysing)